MVAIIHPEQELDICFSGTHRTLVHATEFAASSLPKTQLQLIFCRFCKTSNAPHRALHGPVWIGFAQIRYPNRSKFHGLGWFGFYDFIFSKIRTEPERVGSVWAIGLHVFFCRKEVKKEKTTKGLQAHNPKIANPLSG